MASPGSSCGAGAAIARRTGGSIRSSWSGPVVAILPVGRPPGRSGTEEVEVEVITCVPPAKVGISELASEADDLAAAAAGSILSSSIPRWATPLVRRRCPAAAPAGVAVVDAVAAAPAMRRASPDAS
jgi:hypothetical protein